MKKIILLLAIHCSLFIINCHAQQGQWTWMNGTNATNSAAVHGTQTIFAAGNTPPGCYEACQWTDQQGFFWLFAGLSDYGDDLWKFDPAINQWAWMKGPGIGGQAGIYGTLQVPALTNNPGGRGFGEVTWLDNNNILWMYGGFGQDINNTTGWLGDLWKYDMTTNEWTWMSGSNTAASIAVYGTKGVPDPSNTPGGLCESNASWVDHNNNLWMFGGDLTNSAGGGTMWMYNTTTNLWTWVSGSNVVNNAAVYGTKGVPDTANMPSGRLCYASWKANNEDFWLFGGNQIGTGGLKNDMWRYRPSTNEWTWMSGSTAADNPGNSGANCVPDTSFNPNARTEDRACWTLGCDNFVNYGGGMGDMWNFNANTMEWTCMNGTANASTTPNWGTILISSATNNPGSRNGSLGWKDNQGNLWMFGGAGTYNDMWKFVPDTTCPHAIGNSGPVTSAFHATPLNGCVPLTVVFTNTSINGTNYIWHFGDNDSSYASNPTHTYTDTGTFSVTLITINNSSCGTGADTTVIINYIHVKPSAHISFTADTALGCSPMTVHFHDTTTGVISYLWRFGDGDSSMIPNPSHVYSIHGTYTVTLIGYGANGCNDTVQFSPIIVDTLPVVNTTFSAMPLSGCNPLTVNFTNSSTTGINYVWKFGDNATDTTNSPSHTYTSSGIYSITLYTTDSSFCGVVKDSIKQLNYITVNAQAIADFSPDSVLGCVPFTVHFTNNSSNATSYHWDFGDTHSSTSSNSNNTYSTAGAYTVTLIAIGAGGCNDTIQKSYISVINAPVVTSQFTADTLNGCTPLTVIFNNLSTNGTIYLWRFGDGGTSISANPTHTFLDSGVYTVTLITTNDTSICGKFTDSIVQTHYITVVDPVNVTTNFSVSPMNGCIPLAVNLINSSTNGTTYYWTLGNGSWSTDKNPPPTFYVNSGIYNITLITFNKNDKCYNPPDTMIIQIIADSCNLYIPNVFSPNGDGKNEFYHLIAEGYSNYHLIIFDRWGLKVFESNDKSILWNGKINNSGGDAPDGTYYYIFTAIDFYNLPFTDKGIITVIR